MAVTRDNLLNGQIDGAHCLYSMPASVATGVGGKGDRSLRVAMMLSSNGQAITLARSLRSEELHTGGVPKPCQFGGFSLRPVIADVAEELREVARASDDAAGYFVAMYARVTSSIATSITQNQFADGARMERFATTFAGYYTRCLGPVQPAAEGRSDPGPVRPGCWRASFDVAGRDDLLIVQHLLIGMNAHINFDLPQATVDVALATGDLRSIRGDFDRINQILRSMTIVLLRDLDRVSHWANEAGALGGGRLFNFSLERARDQAWSAAERLFAMPEAERPSEVAELDRLVSVLAYLVTEPSLPVKLLARLARRLEEHDPKKVIAALLGDRMRRRP